MLEFLLCHLFWWYYYFGVVAGERCCQWGWKGGEMVTKKVDKQKGVVLSFWCFAGVKEIK